MRTAGWWARRTQVERVVVYTLGSVYVLYWFLLALAGLGAVSAMRSPLAVTLGSAGTLALGVAGTLVLRSSTRLHPHTAPLPWRPMSLLLALVLVATGLSLLLPQDPRTGFSLVIVAALAWGAGGLLDTRIRTGVLLACAAIAGLLSGSIGFALYGLAASAFLVFTVQSSLWLMGVVTSLERARDNEAELAVARERLRFSQDVHDVMGRRLSTIAVQAELAAALAARGDSRATDQVLEIRSTAHEALREARELARGYRPLHLPTEVEGAVSLLGSAGIAAEAELDGVPADRHEPVARVIREAVTNVLRHSRASRVEMTYADQELVVANDGVMPERPSGGDGSGLATLADHLAQHGARVTSGADGDRFVVRVSFAPAASEVEA
ncbi:sensor histidine kinase [Nocardioides sp. LHG3406-4]|uniref:sensor histidine kinase n=1 Tax=Nocardioides sp. LHG3406-4 TaxID=2804575 RepID=UPI003CE78BB6